MIRVILEMVGKGSMQSAQWRSAARQILTVIERNLAEAHLALLISMRKSCNNHVVTGRRDAARLICGVRSHPVTIRGRRLMNSPAFTHEEASRNFKPIEQASGLPQRAYVDKESHKGEVRGIFNKEWIAVFDHRWLPKAGDYRSMDTAGRPRLTELWAEILLRFVFINFDEDARPVASRLEGQSKNFAPWGGAAEHRL